jgi:hypothetical protein
MTAKIGWDQLLKIRSNVFVMEEEYRSEKQPVEEPKRSASTDVLRGTPDRTSNGSDTQDDSAENVKDDYESIARTIIAGNINGETNMQSADHSVEKPENTIDKEEVKAGNEDVS